MAFRLQAHNVVDKAFINTASTSIGTGAYVQLIAATAGATTALQAQNGTTVPMILAIGSSGHEVDFLYLHPSGSAALIPAEISKGARISLKSTAGTLSSGIISLNLFG